MQPPRLSNNPAFAVERAQLVRHLTTLGDWQYNADSTRWNQRLLLADYPTLGKAGIEEIVNDILGPVPAKVYPSHCNTELGESLHLSMPGPDYQRLAAHELTRSPQAIEDARLRSLLQQRLFSKKAGWTETPHEMVAQHLPDLDYGTRSAAEVTQLVREAFEGQCDAPGLQVSAYAAARDGHFTLRVAVPKTSFNFVLRDATPDCVVEYAELQARAAAKTTPGVHP